MLNMVQELKNIMEEDGELIGAEYSIVSRMEEIKYSIEQLQREYAELIAQQAAINIAREELINKQAEITKHIASMLGNF